MCPLAVPINVLHLEGFILFLSQRKPSEDRIHEGWTANDDQPDQRVDRICFTS